MSTEPVEVRFQVTFVRGLLEGLNATDRIRFPSRKDARRWVEGVQLRLLDKVKYYHSFELLCRGPVEARSVLPGSQPDPESVAPSGRGNGGVLTTTTKEQIHGTR